MHAEPGVVGRRKEKKSPITTDGKKEFNQYMHYNFIDFNFTDF